jgi:hemoglobin
VTEGLGAGVDPWDAPAVRPSLFEFAGGEPAFLALAAAHHARCLADPELNHPFSGTDRNPHHVRRLAAYWAEVLGGPPQFSDACSDHSAVLRMHSGNGAMDDLGRRFIACFDHAMDDAELPADPQFRAAMHAYMVWATADVTAFPTSSDEVPSRLSMPRWSWDGLERAPRRHPEGSTTS